MNILGLIFNIGTVISVVRNLVSLVKEVAEKKSLPDCEHVDTTLDSVEKLFKSKAVKIGDLDTDKLADSIQQIRDQLKCKTP